MSFSTRCSTCGINWPVRFHSECPRCGGHVDPSPSSPSEDWSAVLAEHVQLAHENDKPADPWQTVVGGLKKSGKKTWTLSSYDVVRSGIHSRLQPDTVVRVLDGETELFVEVLGYSYSGRLYAVRLIKTKWPVDSKGRAFVPKRWLPK